MCPCCIFLFLSPSKRCCANRDWQGTGRASDGERTLRKGLLKTITNREEISSDHKPFGNIVVVTEFHSNLTNLGRQRSRGHNVGEVHFPSFGSYHVQPLRRSILKDESRGQTDRQTERRTGRRRDRQNRTKKEGSTEGTHGGCGGPGGIPKRKYNKKNLSLISRVLFFFLRRFCSKPFVESGSKHAGR